MKRKSQTAPFRGCTHKQKHTSCFTEHNLLNSVSQLTCLCSTVCVCVCVTCIISPLCAQLQASIAAHYWLSVSSTFQPAAMLHSSVNPVGDKRHQYYEMYPSQGTKCIQIPLRCVPAVIFYVSVTFFFLFISLCSSAAPHSPVSSCVLPWRPIPRGWCIYSLISIRLLTQETIIHHLSV